MDLGIAINTVTKVMREHWPDIKHRVKPAWLPRSEPKAGFSDHYGCGYYGCVMPTKEDGVVLKLTTDPLEVEFLMHAARLRWPDGIVRYYDIMPLPGSSVRHRGAWLVWREEAYNVGGAKWIIAVHGDDYRIKARIMVQKRLFQFQRHSHDVFLASKKAPHLLAEAKRWDHWAWNTVDLEVAEDERWMKHWRGGERIAARLRACEIIAEMMANEPEGDEIGSTLSFYLEKKILLADVHVNNIGEVHREDYSKPFLAIVDPGHAVFLP